MKLLRDKRKKKRDDKTKHIEYNRLWTQSKFFESQVNLVINTVLRDSIEILTSGKLSLQTFPRKEYQGKDLC